MSALTTRRPVSPTHHPAGASLDLLHVSPYQSGGLAHTQPGVPASGRSSQRPTRPDCGCFQLVPSGRVFRVTTRRKGCERRRWVTSHK